MRILRGLLGEAQPFRFQLGENVTAAKNPAGDGALTQQDTSNALQNRPAAHLARHPAILEPHEPFRTPVIARRFLSILPPNGLNRPGSEADYQHDWFHF
jgi:hypothetical protein